MSHTDRLFPKRSRLLKSSEFKTVFDNRCSAGNKLFTCYGAANGSEQARIGLVVSRKVSLKAVERNRIKRLVRETFRHHKERLSGLDIVVVARRAMTEAGTTEGRDALHKNWNTLIRKCKKS